MKILHLPGLLLSLSATTVAQVEAPRPAETSQATEGETPQLSAEQGQYPAWAADTWNAMAQQTGEIELPGGVTSLDVPEGFYYLSRWRKSAAIPRGS